MDTILFQEFDILGIQTIMQKNNSQESTVLKAKFEEYFHNLRAQGQAAADYHVKSVEEAMLYDINNSNVVIPQQETPLPFKKIKTQDQGKDDLSEIKKEKGRIEEKLRDLQNQEKNIIQRSKEKQFSMSKSRVKSQFNEQEKEAVKQMAKKLKQFEKSLHKKTEQLEKSQIINMKKEQEQKLVELKAINQRKKQKISKNLEQISQREAEREKMFKESAFAIKKVQAKRKLHLILEEQWRHKEEQEEKQKTKEMQKRMKDQTTDFESLKQHQKQYESIIAERKMQNTQRKMQMSKVSQNSSCQFPASRFYQIIEEEEKKAKEIEKQKQQCRKVLRDKKQQYAELVKSTYAPKIKQKTEHQDLQQETQKRFSAKIALSNEEQRRAGDQYLRSGNKLAKKISQSEDTFKMTSKQNETLNMIDQKKSYPDYLTQSRVYREELNPYGSPVQNPKVAAEKIMKSQKLREQEKLDQLRLLASKFDSSTTNIVQKIRGKLHMLEAIR